MSQNSLFCSAFKTPRTPPKILSKSESELNKVTTRSQTKLLEKTFRAEKTKDDTTLQQDIAKIEFNPKPSLISNFKMEAFKLQKLIAVTIPEFNSKDKEKQSENLTRFLNAADNIYDSLKTEDEQNTFNKLIILKLGDEAFTRVNNRRINTYPEIKTLLKDIYRKTYSLEELERMYTDIKQSYGESIRNYGYRILESLEKYKNGFKEKYNTKVIDVAYEKHLNTNTVKIFKRGLNNTILKDKIVTSTATKIEDIILESEIIEKMLLETVSQTSSQIDRKSENFNVPRLLSQDISSLPKLICNYCQKPGHTLDKCRIRINSEIIALSKMNQFAPTQNQYRTQIPLRQNTWNSSKLFNKPDKFCSYCKTTKGHTFDECRNKFLQRQPQNYSNSAQVNYQGNQSFQQQRNNFNGQQQYQQSSRPYQKPQMSFPSYPQQQNKPPNFAQNYSQQNNYQPRYNYPNSSPYQQNTYSQQQDNSQQRNYSRNYIPDRNQQLANRNHNPQNEQANDNTNTLNKINSIYPDQGPVTQGTDQENSNGSSQN